MVPCVCSPTLHQQWERVVTHPKRSLWNALCMLKSVQHVFSHSRYCMWFCAFAWIKNESPKNCWSQPRFEHSIHFPYHPTLSKLPGGELTAKPFQHTHEPLDATRLHNINSTWQIRQGKKHLISSAGPSHEWLVTDWTREATAYPLCQFSWLPPLLLFCMQMLLIILRHFCLGDLFSLFCLCDFVCLSVCFSVFFYLMWAQ